jgi:hypothetical protein
MGSSVSLSQGLNRFGFTGQWGVDFDVYVSSSETKEAKIGQWSQPWHPSPEKWWYQHVIGKPFEETQYTLRVKGKNDFQTLILPFKAGERPADLSVTQDGENYIVRYSGKTTTMGQNFSSYSDGTGNFTLSSFGSETVAYQGIQISGGTAEVQLSSSEAKIVLDGDPGTRRIKLPRNAHLADASSSLAHFDSSTQEWVIDYSAADTIEIRVILD